MLLDSVGPSRAGLFLIRLSSQLRRRAEQMSSWSTDRPSEDRECGVSRSRLRGLGPLRAPLPEPLPEQSVERPPYHAPGEDLVARTDAPGRDLPERFGRWKSVAERFSDG
jgi:hypothetical protein